CVVRGSGRSLSARGRNPLPSARCRPRPLLMFHSLAGRRLPPKLPRSLLRLVLGLTRRPVRRAARLAAFPTEGLPVERPVTIRWNEQLVPYIEAETDRDLAVALGAVHAHLREGQMDFLRLLAQ